MRFPSFQDMNPFARFFRRGRVMDDNTSEELERAINSQGYSQEDLEFGTKYSQGYNMYGQDEGGFGLNSISIQFDQFFREKSFRIFKYREMSYYPDINDAIDMVCDEAVCDDSNGDILTLTLKEEVPEYIEEELRKHWDYIVNDVYSFNDTGWELFRRWLIDSELYVELILDDDGEDIIDFKVLAAQTVSPVFIDSDIEGYVQTMDMAYYGGASAHTSDDMGGQSGHNGGGGAGGVSSDNGTQEINFDKDQIVYINYGETGRNKLDIRGFLDSSIRIYNQLKHLEDAVVVYRIVRAPERRIWNVSVGRMPKGKAEQYIRGLIQRYRKQITYDPSTGAMDSSKNFQAVLEDYWFAKDENGEGTTVDTLAGGQNLGEMDDVYYFQKKLHQNLKLPKNRWGYSGDDSESTFSGGKSGEITREEIKFSRFIERLQKRFAPLLMESFLTQLRLKMFDDVYIDESIYRITFTQSNLFRQYKELDLLESRFGVLGAIDTYVYRPGENEQGWFSKEFVLKNWFLMSEDEYNDNAELLKREQEAARIAADNGFGPNSSEGDDFGDAEGSGGDFGGGDLGGDFGGGDMGGGDMGGEFGGGETGGGAEADFGADTGGGGAEFDA